MENKSSSTFIFLTIISILNFFFIFLIKYDLNGLSLAKINFLYIGNIIPILMEIFFLLSMFLLAIKNKSLKFIHRATLVLLSAISFLLLLFSYVIVKIDFSFGNNYLFHYPITKVIVGVSLILSILLTVFLISLLINFIFNDSFVVYLKSFFSTSLVFIIIFGAILVFTTKQKFNGKGIKSSPTRIGVVLGAAVWKNNQPSPVLKGRIEKSVELFNKKIISAIQFTGSNSPGEISEAKAASRYAMKKGVRKHFIRIEEKSTTTTEQIKFIRKKIDNSKFNPVVVISDQFHLARVKEIADFFDVSIIGISSDYKIDTKRLIYYRLRESVALLFFWLFAI